MENPIASLAPLNVGESDVCRLCMKIREYYLNIFVSTEVFKMSIGMAIQDLLVLEVAKGDSLPEMVCCSCCTKLMEFRDFKEMCVNSARELMGMHAPMEAVTCPVKVEFLDDELSDEGERNKWNEFVEDQGSAHSNEAYEAEEAGVTDSDASELHEEKNENGEEIHVKIENSEGATVYIESSTVMLGDQCDVEKKKTMGSMFGAKCEMMEDTDGEDFPANTISSMESDPLDVGQIVPGFQKIEKYGNGNRKITSEDNYPKVGGQGNPQNHTGGKQRQKVHSDGLEYTCRESHPFKCDLCDKTFKFHSAFADHLKIHSEVKPFACNTCDKGFNRKSHLWLHLNTHAGIKPFHCDTCGKGFASQSNLKSHSVVHSGQKPFKCQRCDKGFTRKKQLQRHEDGHIGLKPFHCNVCEECFKNQSDLINHSMVHSVLKPFKCQTCGKSFTRNKSLQAHLNVHTGVRPFQCKTCGKSFARESNLGDHLVVHSSVRPFECQKCGKAYKRKSYYNYHLKNSH